MKLFSYYPSCATVSSTRRTPPRHNCQCRINHTSAFEAASISIYLQYSSAPSPTTRVEPLLPIPSKEVLE